MNPATERLREWRYNPVQFVQQVFGVEPDLWQADVLAEMGKPGRKRIAMKACAGPGKTAVLAWAGWHRLVCFAAKGEHPKGIAVSCTYDNLETNLWPELAKWQNRSEFLRSEFQWTKTRLFYKQFPETWFLDAKGYPKSADPETIGRTLSGLHGYFPFALIDESGDIPPTIARSAEQALTSCEDGLVITAGNTTSHSGLLYHVCTHGRDSWFVASITADPDDLKRTPRVDLEWAREQIRQHGRENPWVMAYVLGQFPPASINSLLSLEEVEAAMNRHIHEQEYSWSQKRIGVDVARFGDDRSVVFPRQGLVAFKPAVMRHQRTTDISARVIQGNAKWKPEMVFVDDTGHWGHGVIDNLLAAGLSPVGIQFHGKPIDPRYLNRRAEMWFGMADWVKRGGCLPNIPEMVAELTTPTYTHNHGKIQLEEKDQIKKRLGRSPDLADALALTFAYADEPGREHDPYNLMGAKPRVQTEFDPYKVDL